MHRSIFLPRSAKSVGFGVLEGTSHRVANSPTSNQAPCGRSLPTFTMGGNV